MMRIGFDAKRAFNNETGLGNYSRFIISSLIKLFPQNEYFLFTPTIKTAFENFIATSSVVKIVSPESLAGKTFPSLWRTYAIPEMCNQLKLDIFHGLSNELPVGIEKFPGKKIVTVHDLIFLRYPSYYNNIDRYIYTKKFRYSCEKADVIIAASHQTKNDIIHYFKTDASKIEVVYQDCDERFSVPASAKQKDEVSKKYSLPERFILCVGTIEQRKDQLTVLKAFHRLDAKKLKLVFVGRQTDYIRQLKDFTDKNNMNGKVLFLPHLEPEYLPVIFQLAGILVYASEFEGFGIPVLEGMKTGVPVITAGTSSLTEVGGDAVVYFNFGDASELSEKMRVLLDNDLKRNEMIAKGLLQAKKFDREIIASQLCEIYRI